MAYTEIELGKMLGEARESLMKIPGVKGVGFGYKQKAGEITNTLCWRVYVEEKKAKGDVPQNEVIPASFSDFDTDVIKLPVIHSRTACEDSVSYSPLLSGATISNMVPAANGKSFVGTLGFFATINGNTDAKNNVAFVTNHHVAAKNNAQNGADMWQPHREDRSGASTIVTYQESSSSQAPPVPRHEKIGEILNIGDEVNHPYTYSGEPNPPGHLGWFVDAASVKVDLSISSWCDTHCGTKFKAQVQGLNINNSNEIAGYERVSPAILAALSDGAAYNVVKWGHRTSRTEGKVIDCVGSAIVNGLIVQNVICIVATSNNCEGNMVFSKEGDSGSAIINASRKIIGLLFGGVTDMVHGVSTDITLASHIHPVLDYLAVTPITTAVPHTFMSTKAEGPGSITGDHLFLLKAQLRNIPEGAAMLDIFDVHRHELVELVNHCRPVTVAWQRNQGPAFTNRIMANSRNPEIPIPGQIEGISLRRLCEAMLPMLLAHGSPALQDSLNTWSARILAKTEGLHNLHALVASLQTDSKI